MFIISAKKIIECKVDVPETISIQSNPPAGASAPPLGETLIVFPSLYAVTLDEPAMGKEDDN